MTLRGLWKHLEGVWKYWGAYTWSPKVILGDSCSEIDGFKGAFESTSGSVGSISVDLRIYVAQEQFGRQMQRNQCFYVGFWGPLKALGSTYMEPRVHFGIQLKRNQWFQGTEGGSRGSKM